MRTVIIGSFNLCLAYGSENFPSTPAVITGLLPARAIDRCGHRLVLAEHMRKHCGSSQENRGAGGGFHSLQLQTACTSLPNKNDVE
jgi:hypothetical protein